MTSVQNPFGVDGLSKEQIERLQQAAEMISDGDAEMYERILDGTSTNLEKLMKKCDGSAEAIEAVVDKAEMQMTDLAFGDDGDVFDELADEPIENELEALLAGDSSDDDEFMGGGNFTSLSDLEDEELGGDMSYEEFQDEWN